MSHAYSQFMMIIIFFVSWQWKIFHIFRRLHNESQIHTKNISSSPKKARWMFIAGCFNAFWKLNEVFTLSWKIENNSWLTRIYSSMLYSLNWSTSSVISININLKILINHEKLVRWFFWHFRDFLTPPSSCYKRINKIA